MFNILYFVKIIIGEFDKIILKKYLSLYLMIVENVFKELLILFIKLV